MISTPGRCSGCGQYVEQRNCSQECLNCSMQRTSIVEGETCPMCLSDDPNVRGEISWGEYGGPCGDPFHDVSHPRVVKEPED